MASQANTPDLAEKLAVEQCDRDALDKIWLAAFRASVRGETCDDEILQILAALRAAPIEDCPHTSALYPISPDKPGHCKSCGAEVRHGDQQVPAPTEAAADVEQVVDTIVKRELDAVLYMEPAVDHISSKRKIDRKGALAAIERIRRDVRAALASTVEAASSGVEDKNLTILINDLRAYAGRKVGSLRIDMADVRSILALYDSRASARCSREGTAAQPRPDRRSCVRLRNYTR